jgi:8-oxo-dGTP diphosphatase
MPHARARIAIAVVEEDGRYLVGQRPPGVALAGYWEFPGGMIEPGETPPAAAARECLEETGVEVLVGEECFTAEHEYDHGDVELHFFRCQPVRPEQTPRAPFVWIEPPQLARIKFPPANDGLLRLLRPPLAAER